MIDTTTPLMAYLVIPLVTALLILLYGYLIAKITGISLSSQEYYLIFIVGLVYAILRSIVQNFLISRYNLGPCVDRLNTCVKDHIEQRYRINPI